MSLRTFTRMLVSFGQFQKTVMSRLDPIFPSCIIGAVFGTGLYPLIQDPYLSAYAGLVFGRSFLYLLTQDPLRI